MTTKPAKMGNKPKKVSPRTWRKKLLSGDVGRTKGRLARPDVYLYPADSKPHRCCLGVLLDLEEVAYSQHAQTMPYDHQLPEWLTKHQAEMLAKRNDEVERGAGWSTGGRGVIAYIDRYIIPAYDKARKAKEGKAS